MEDAPSQTEVGTQESTVKVSIVEPRVEPKGRLSELGERIQTYVEHRILKFKEHFGTIKEPEFQRLLHLDLNEELRRNPPLSGEAPHLEDTPDALKLLGIERGEEVTEDTVTLLRQQRAMSVFKTHVQRYMYFNPDVSRDALMGIKDSFSQAYSFDEEQLQLATNIVDKYKGTREQVLALWRDHADEAENHHGLVQQLTGFEVPENARIKVTLGPMSIDIKTTKDLGAKIWKHRTGNKIPKNIVGFCDQPSDESPTMFTVRWGRGEQLPTLKHEWKHAENRFMGELFWNTQQYYLHELQQAYENETQTDKKGTRFGDVLVANRNIALERVRDEIVAIKRNPEPVNANMFTKKGSPYDFFGEARHTLLRRRDGESSVEQRSKGKDWTRIMKKEYSQIIARAVKAFDKLTKTKGFSRERTLALLEWEPLESWPKIVDRQIRLQRALARMS